MKGMRVPLVKSMTGYGRAESVFEERAVTVEVRSVNNRYLDCSIKMPRTYIFAEEAMKGRVQSAVGRGKVDVFVSVANIGGDAVSVTVNEPLAKAYMDALARLGRLGGGKRRKKKYSLTDLAQFPDVLVVEKKPENQERLSEQLLSVLDLALEDHTAMREREGQRMVDDILGRTVKIEQLVSFVEERSPQTVSEYRAKLEAKMAEVLQNTKLDDARLLTEAAIFADKVAVDEETVRLRSHISQLRELLDRGGAVGRKLDFLIQEFNREANTIGSKCGDIEVTRCVVDIKAEIEKIREQIQNLE